MLPVPQHNRPKPAQFRPPIMRLQSPFNRQGAQLSKTLFLSDLLHRQIVRQFHGEFIFSFSTNTNIQSVKHTTAMTIISLVFYILLLVYGTFIDFTHNENKFNQVANGLAIVFHPLIDKTPGSVFLTPPFYIQIVIAIISFVAYIGMIKFHLRSYLGSGFNLFFQYLCYGLSFPFCLFSVTNFLYSVIFFSRSNRDSRTLFLINPILAVFSFPAIMICLYCVHSDVRISSLPFVNINPRKSELWFFLCCSFALLQTMFIALDLKDTTSNYWMCIVLILIALKITNMTYRHPIYLPIFTKIMTSAVSTILFNLSFFSFVQCFSSNIYLPTIAFSLSFAGLLFSILFHLLKHMKINKFLKSVEKVEFHDFNEYYMHYVYCSQENIPKLATKELFDYFEEKYPTEFRIQIIILRYLSHVNNYSVVFEKSVSLLKILAGDFFISIQLTGLIEQTSDIVGNTTTAANIRQQQLDSILEQSISSQLEFWRAVLLENPTRISECAVWLYQDVKNAKVFFKQLGVDEKSTDQYGIKYVDFLMNVAVDLVLLEHVDVDATRPVPYNQRFAMHQPRRDSKTTPLEKPQPKFAPFALKTEAKLESFPSLMQESQRKSLISEDRIELCKCAKKKRLQGENLRVVAFLLYYSLLAILSLVLFILIVIKYAGYSKDASIMKYIHQDMYHLFNCSVVLLKYKSSPYFNYNFPVDRPFVETCLKKSNESIFSNSNLAELMDQSLFVNVINNLFRLFDYESSDPEDLVTNNIFYNLANQLTHAAYQYLSTLDAMMAQLSYSTDSFRIIIKKLYVISAIIFAILLPFFIGAFISLVSALSKLFWQPLLIPKTEAANVFQAYQHISSPERRKSHIRSEQFNRHKAKPRVTFPKYKWTLGSIAFYFVLQIFVCEMLLLIFEQEVNRFAGLSFSFGNCSTVMSHVTTNIYRFIPLAYNTSSYRFYNWFTTTLAVLRLTVTDFQTSNQFPEYEFIEYEVPTVNQTLSQFDNLSMFPFANSTINQDFYHAIISTYMVMSETLIAVNASGSITRMKDMIHYETTADAFFHSTFADYDDSMNVYHFLAIFVLVLFVVLEVAIMYVAIKKQKEIREMVNLIIRTMILLPDRTPLVEPGKTDIKFFDKKPESPTMKMIQVLPVGIIITDKNNAIVHYNTKASEIFGNINKGVKINDLKSPPMQYFSTSEHSMSQFPTHPFDKKLPGNYYFVYNDISQLSLNKIEHYKLQTELKEMRRYRLPSSVTVTRKGQKQNVIMMDNFAMVEATFSSALDEDAYVKLKEGLEKKIDPIPTVFLSEFNRDSVVIVFSSFNVQSHQRQFLRDALKCAHIISEASKKYSSKVSVINGTKCICKLTDHEQARVSFYAPSMTKAAMMLRFGIEGDIIVEWSIMKTMSGIDSATSKFDSGPICNKDVDFCLISQDNNVLKSFFGNVSTPELVFS
ncbi:hypothetical protein TRFO_25073 [Tritrichomonas foetus]|uniref:PAS domain-containing protein n=1 Tax=Tritrichomonas foetus TaxID=1144522 RepID=A0A1J4K6L9_9EUKA|nr:hypothetical protein TRFO_25073 [Tritrichomonas foetus]|eukprot:OHT06827.1 hypothetical protein TRFO_25073 [Tritrichomonas foetus]